VSNLEKASHVCVILASILLSAVLFGKLLSTHAAIDPGGGALVDRKLAMLPEVHWHESERTILLALSARCQHCLNSAPFYRRLVAKIENSRSVRVLALFPEGDEEAKAFLEHAGINIPYIGSAPYAEIGIGGTPTILQTNSDGVVVREWQGELTPWQQKKMLADATDSKWSLGHLLGGL